MAKKIQTTNKPLAENYIHVHTGKIQVTEVAVHINYTKGTISLIDSNPDNPSASHNNGKQWIFKKREIEFMPAWLDILDAMKSAVAEATEKLKAYQKEREQRDLELLAKVNELAE